MVGWNILGIVLALILGEATLRWISIEFALYPSKVQFGWPNPVQLHNKFVVDSQLFWVPKNYSAKVAHYEGRQPMIVFMGDSCTHPNAYPRFLKSVITDRNPEIAFTFVTVGVGGWSSYQGLRQLERDVIPMKPRAGTIYYGWNDHWTHYGLEDKMTGEVYRKHPSLLLELSPNIRMATLINNLIFAFKFPLLNSTRGPVRVSLSDFSANLRRWFRSLGTMGSFPSCSLPRPLTEEGKSRAISHAGG